MTFYVPEHQLHLKSDKKSQSGREKYRHEALEEIILHTLGLASLGEGPACASSSSAADAPHEVTHACL